MAEKSDAALLLRRIPYAETSLIVHVLTAEHGKLSLMARGARRPSSPFRAALAPLHALRLAWRPSRRGMGNLTDVERGEAMVNEARMLEGLQLNALAERLFHEGDPHRFTVLVRAFSLLAARSSASGLLAASWHMLKEEGWLGSLDHCWRCGRHGEGGWIWQAGELCCRGCASGGTPLAPEFLRRIHGLMEDPGVSLSSRDRTLWRCMLQGVLRRHGLKPLLVNTEESGRFGMRMEG